MTKNNFINWSIYESFLITHSQCCDVHDYCYDTCGADKDECDLRFKKCLYATCKTEKTGNGYFDTKKCRLKAKLFFITVLGVGCQSYINAQKAACQCVKSELWKYYKDN